MRTYPERPYSVSHAAPHTNDAMVLLRLPSAWVKELDAIAHSRMNSRTSVIRMYIREKLDGDLESLSQQIEKQEKFGKTVEWVGQKVGQMERFDTWSV